MRFCRGCNGWCIVECRLRGRKNAQARYYQKNKEKKAADNKRRYAEVKIAIQFHRSQKCAL